MQIKILVYHLQLSVICFDDVLWLKIPHSSECLYISKHGICDTDLEHIKSLLLSSSFINNDTYELTMIWQKNYKHFTKKKPIQLKTEQHKHYQNRG